MRKTSLLRHTVVEAGELAAGSSALATIRRRGVVLSFHYELHLRHVGYEDVLRYTSYRRLGEGDTVALAGRGVWRIAVMESAQREALDGIAYCEPAPAANG
jgi:hypothetical protein